jgi:prepilin-type N-terminal cleavage/methylation domain-containing protein
MLTRRGFTIVELLIALVLTGIIAGTATLSLLRQQRTHLAIGAVSDAERQLASATTIVAQQFRFLDQGDLVAGEARDTALQVRAPVASSIACGSSSGSVVFLPDSDGLRLTGILSEPQAGDSLWWNVDTAWKSVEVRGVSSVNTSCVAPIPVSGRATRLILSRNDTIPAGAFLRVTRPVRYVVYRAGDGSWQLGLREWSGTTFSAPQPVAGPFMRTLGALRTEFRFFDDADSELPATGTSADVHSIARIRFVARYFLSVHDRGADSVMSDSIVVAIGRAP